jgi:hypothetical protein
VSDSSVLDRAVKPKILSCFKLALKVKFLPAAIPKIASQSQFRQEKARQPPFIKDAGAAVACKSRPFTGSQRNNMPYTVTPTHIPDLLILEPKADVARVQKQYAGAAK